jgi:hypothetical protein
MEVEVEVSIRWAGVMVTTAALMLPAAASAQDNTDTLTPLQIAMACAPPLPSADEPMPHLVRVVGSQSPEHRSLIGTRDLLIVDGGTEHGVSVGQEYFVRRINTYAAKAGMRTHARRTTAWVRIVSANEKTAIAAVEHACGPVLADDYLEPFVTPAPPAGAEAVDTSGELDFTSPARVVYSNEEHHTAAVGDFVLIDQGAAPGARFAFYRDPLTPGLPLAAIGEGVVVATSASMALVRINASTGEIESGDYLVRRK